MSIWIVDDDATLRKVVREILEQEGFEVREFHRPDGIIEALDARPELILLDVRMPQKSGTELCREIRARSAVPIIFLSSAGETIDRVIGLEVGADDYMVKPFHPRELAARVHAVLRRARSNQDDSAEQTQTIVVGALALDALSFKVSLADEELSLTQTEFRLIQTLMSQPQKVFSRRELISLAYDGTRVSKKTIDSHIRRLRASFQPHDIDPIRTVRGVGYALDVDILQAK